MRRMLLAGLLATLVPGCGASGTGGGGGDGGVDGSGSGSGGGSSSGGSSSGGGATGTIGCGTTSACNVASSVCCPSGNTLTCAASCSNGGFTCISPGMCPAGSLCCIGQSSSTCRAACETGENAACEIGGSGEQCGDSGLQCGELEYNGLGSGILNWCSH